MKNAIKLIIPESVQLQSQVETDNSNDENTDHTDYHVGQKRLRSSDHLPLYGNKRVQVVEGQMYTAIRRLSFTPNTQVVEGQMYTAIRRLSFTPNTQGSPAVAVSNYNNFNII